MVRRGLRGLSAPTLALILAVGIAVTVCLGGCGRLGYEAVISRSMTDASSTTNPPGRDGAAGDGSPVIPSTDAGAGADATASDAGMGDAGDPGAPDCVPSAAVALSGGTGVNWPAIAWDGTAYGVTWSATVGGQTEVFFARVSRTGQLLTPSRQVSTAAGEPAFRPDIASDGGAFAIGWESDDEAYVAIVGSDGTTLSAETQVSVSPGFESSRAAITWTGSSYAVVWKDDRNGLFEVYLSSVSSSGTPGPEVRLTNTAGQSQQPSVAAASSRLLVAFQDDVSGMQHIYAQVTDLDGAALAPLSQLDAASAGTIPSVAANGISFQVAWGIAGSDVAVVSVDPTSGTPTGAVAQLNDDPGTTPKIVPFRDGYAAFWPDFASDAVGFRVTSESGMAVGAPDILPAEPGGVGLIDAAYDESTGAGVVWVAPTADALRFMHTCP